MKRFIVALFIIALSAGASQIFHMNLYEALQFTDNIYMARIGSIINFPMDYMERMEYTFLVLEVIQGEEPFVGGFICAYIMDLPRCYTDSEGNEVWESPLVTGSGFEMTANEGDTVIVLTGPLGCDASQTVSMVRIEPMDSLGEILQLLEAE